ncbi:MAG: HD domain-containing protein [Desulfobulbaceae bacterium]|nr:MAG: HD domain-containing protein [Desulfobulbaceae bacterium]
MLKRLQSLIHQHHPDTLAHSRRVSLYASMIAGSICNDSEMQDRTVRSAAIHDIGKLYIPAEILNKPRELDTRERVMICSHAHSGYNILNQAGGLKVLAEPVLHHHERFDGSGYPFGLSGQSIPLESRIISVADTFDALTSERNYNTQMSQGEALAEITYQSGKMFDPEVVYHFHMIVKEMMRTHGVFNHLAVH